MPPVYKSIFISDVHMSNRLPGAKATENGMTDRLEDQVKLWDHVRETARERKIDKFKIVGDLFDKALVDPVTLTTTAECLVSLEGDKFLLPGNHDAASIRGERFVVEAFGALKKKGIQVLRYGEPYRPQDWIVFHPMPYATVKESRAMLSGIRAHIRDVTWGALQNVLLMHQSVLGCTHLKWKCDDGLSPEEVTEGFTQTIAGHFHDHQKFGPDLTGLYLSAPMHHSYQDVNRRAGYWIWTYRPGKEPKGEFIDPGLPKFHRVVVKDGTITVPKDMRPGDFARWSIFATHADMAVLAPQADMIVAKELARGVRAEWHHSPIQRKVDRLSGEVSTEETPTLSLEKQIRRYAKHAGTGELDFKTVVREGRDILLEARAESPEAAAHSGKAHQLVELRATDFTQFETVTLPLAKQGLVWIGAENRDTSSANSNGAGKTNLSRALTWALYGETIAGDSVTGSDGDGVIRDGAKRATVEVDLEDGWTIKRERSKGSPKLSLLHKGEPFVGGTKQVEAKIQELVGLDFRGFRNTALYGQNDTARFADPKVGDATRKEMLHLLLRMEILKACAKLARDRAGERRRKQQAVELEAEKIKAAIEALDWKGILEKVEAWKEENESAVQELRAEATEHDAEAEDVLQDVPDVAPIEKKLKKLGKELSAAEKAAETATSCGEEADKLAEPIAKADAARSDARSELLTTEAALEALDGDACSVCSSPIDEGHAAKHKRALQKKHTAQTEALAVAQAALNELREKQADARARQKAAGSEALQARSIREDIEELQGRVDSAKSAKERARVFTDKAKAKREEAAKLEGATNPHIAYLEEVRDKLKGLNADLKKKRAEAFEISITVAVADYWARGFSNQGLPSFLLDSVMPYITERANHYLETLSDGDITLEFSTQRELKSSKGEMRDEIEIRWTIEGVRGRPPSGGQRRKIEIATDLALMDLAESREGSGLSFFWADEVFDGLDSEGRSRIQMLLQELRARRSTIFVVSHSESMSEIFERTITVIKENGVSRLEAA